MRLRNTTVWILTALLVLGAAGSIGLARTVSDRGPVRSPLDAADREAIKALVPHDIGKVKMTLSNWGEVGNPDGVPGYKGFEFPTGSGNDFLFSAGVWVGAIVDGRRLVSTATDGDNGTNEFYPVHIGTYPALNTGNHDDWHLTSKSVTEFGGRSFIKGAKAVDDDGDWTSADHRDNPNFPDGRDPSKPSANYDGGKGLIGVDDDKDGQTDEEITNGLDDDGDGAVDEDTDETGDINGDGNCNYDPEPHIDEDPAGNMAYDWIDNDNDGLVDDADPDFDGDANRLSDDDDGDGEADEDVNARGVQEYYCVFQDDIESQFVGSPDGDGHSPLKVEVMQRTYAFPEEYAADFVLLDYRIRNKRPLTLEKVYIAMFSDPDIVAVGEGGDAGSADDYNYYQAQNTMMIQYDNPADADGPGPGIFAIRVVKTPVALNLLKVTFANFGRLAGGDPSDNLAKYNLISSGQIAPPTPNQDDWRMLIAFGDSANDGFTIQPGQELPITVAFIAGSDTSDGAKNADWALKMYLNDFQGPSAPEPPVFSLDTYPDRVRIRWWPNSELSRDAITDEQDFEGYIIERSLDAKNWQTIAAYDIIDTLWRYEIVAGETLRVPNYPYEWQNYNLGMPYDRNDTITVKFRAHPDSAEIDTVIYAFEDRNLRPGHTYYYVVRAFDQGVPGADVLYSAITGNYQTAVIARTQQTGAPTQLEGIYVFPNPYKGSHAGEQGGEFNSSKGLTEYPRKIYFMGLPANTVPGKCKIRIFSLGGDHLATIDHANGTEYDQWNLITKNKQEIVSGIYYYTVEYGNDRFIDKFVVIK